MSQKKNLKIYDKMGNLKEKYKQFIDIYFSNGGKAYEAYSAISTKCTEKSARTQSSDLLKKLEKSGYFLEKAEENRKNLDEKHNINRDFLITELKECLASAKKGDEIITENGSYIKIDRQSWLKAIEHLIKMTGEYADVKAKLQLLGSNDNRSLDVNIRTIPADLLPKPDSVSL